MKSKFKQNIGMSVNITVVDTVQKQNKTKLLYRKIEIEIEITETEIKNISSIKYQHECRN